MLRQWTRSGNGPDPFRLTICGKGQTGPAFINQQNSDYALLTDPLARGSAGQPTPSTHPAPSHIRFLSETKTFPRATPQCETARAAHE
jgi:hypothetical protein